MLRNPCTECIFEDNNYYGFSVPFLSLKGFSRKHPKIPDCTCEMSLVLLSYGKNKPCSLVGRARYLKAYMHIISVRRNVAPDDKIAACCHIDIVSRLELPVSHVVLFHVHKGCIRIRFTIIVSALKACYVPVINGLTFKKPVEKFEKPLVSAFPFPTSMYKNSVICLTLSF